MPELVNREWLSFLREFEKTDPEPLLWENPREFDESKIAYLSWSVKNHMAWHRRLTDAWMKRGD